jgi:hypothetical protein
VFGEQAVADPPDVDRVHLELGAAGRHAEERSGVATAVGIAANCSALDGDDVVDLDSKVVEGVEEGSEDRDRSGLSWFREAVVVDVVGM